jgi:hypothetical protein
MLFGISGGFIESERMPSFVKEAIVGSGKEVINYCNKGCRRFGRRPSVSRFAYVKS